MTGACEVWIRDRLEREPTIAGHVLELGSRDVNGSIRREFEDRLRFPVYLGLDLEAGPGVDLQGKAGELPFDDGQFGVIVTLEMLEHDETFWRTLAECHRVLSPEGWLLITTRGFTFPRHDYPNDYWRFSSDGLQAALRFFGFDYADTVEDAADLGVFAAARKVKVSGWFPGSEPRHDRLLPEAQVRVLRERMAGLVPLGITAMADAFSRIEDDRRLLKQLLRECVHGTETPDLVPRIRAALWEDFMEARDDKAGELPGM